MSCVPSRGANESDRRAHGAGNPRSVRRPRDLRADVRCQTSYRSFVASCGPRGRCRCRGPGYRAATQIVSPPPPPATSRGAVEVDHEVVGEREASLVPSGENVGVGPESGGDGSVPGAIRTPG